MIYPELISANQFIKMPWKNGKGNTTELCVKRDAVSKEIIWRLSIASVSEDGDFSDFSGYQRMLVMIAGNGIQLSHQGQASLSLIHQYDFCSFDGAWATTATLLDGPITDFNVIYDPTRVRAKVAILNAGESKVFDSDADQLFALAHKTTASCTISNGSESKELEIAKGDLLRISGSGTTSATLAGEGIICVEIYNR